MAAGAGARWSAEQDACFRAVALHLAELEKHCEEPAVVRGGSISQVHIKSAAQLFAHELTKFVLILAQDSDLDTTRPVCESLCEQASRFSSVVRCTLPDAGPTLRATAVAAQRDVFALCLKVAEETRQTLSRGGALEPNVAEVAYQRLMRVADTAFSNRGATMQVVLDAMRLVRDAQRELAEVRESEAKGEEAAAKEEEEEEEEEEEDDGDDGGDDDGFGGDEDELTTAEFARVEPAKQLLDVVPEVFGRACTLAHKLSEERGGEGEEAAVAWMEAVAEAAKRASVAADEFVSSLYHPQDVDAVVRGASALAQTVVAAAALLERWAGLAQLQGEAATSLAAFAGAAAARANAVVPALSAQRSR